MSKKSMNNLWTPVAYYLWTSALIIGAILSNFSQTFAADTTYNSHGGPPPQYYPQTMGPRCSSDGTAMALRQYGMVDDKGVLLPKYRELMRKPDDKLSPEEKKEVALLKAQQKCLDNEADGDSVISQRNTCTASKKTYDDAKSKLIQACSKVGMSSNQAADLNKCVTQKKLCEECYQDIVNSDKAKPKEECLITDSKGKKRKVNFDAEDDERMGADEISRALGGAAAKYPPDANNPAALAKKNASKRARYNYFYEFCPQMAGMEYDKMEKNEIDVEDKWNKERKQYDEINAKIDAARSKFVEESQALDNEVAKIKDEAENFREESTNELAEQNKKLAERVSGLQARLYEGRMQRDNLEADMGDARQKRSSDLRALELECYNIAVTQVRTYIQTRAQLRAAGQDDGGSLQGISSNQGLTAEQQIDQQIRELEASCKGDKAYDAKKKSIEAEYSSRGRRLDIQMHALDAQINAAQAELQQAKNEAGTKAYSDQLTKIGKKAREIDRKFDDVTQKRKKMITNYQARDRELQADMARERGQMADQETRYLNSKIDMEARRANNGDRNRYKKEDWDAVNFLDASTTARNALTSCGCSSVPCHSVSGEPPTDPKLVASTSTDCKIIDNFVLDADPVDTREKMCLSFKNAKPPATAEESTDIPATLTGSGDATDRKPSSNQSDGYMRTKK